MFNLNEFDKRLCLCVDHRLPQWSELRRQFEDRGIEVETFLTGDGYLRPQEDYRLINNPFALNNTQRCYDGHRAMLEYVRDAGCKTAVFFEDDVALTPEFDTALHTAWDDLNRLGLDWSIFYIGCNFSYGVTEEITPNLLRCRGQVYCCHAMVLNAQKRPLFDELLALPYRPDLGPLDYFIGNIIQKDESHGVYGCWPNAAVQIPSHSVLNNCFMDYSPLFASKGNAYSGK